MTKYYYVGTFLPTLSFAQDPEIAISELDILLRDNLSEGDNKKIEAIRQFYDLFNLRFFWLEQEIDPRGNMSSMELEEALITRSRFPGYVYDFIDQYPKKEDRIHYFPYLLAQFFKGSGNRDPFLGKYLKFEREIRLIMTAFRAKQLRRDLSVEFQYEDPNEELIALLLAQKDDPVFTIPEEYHELKMIFDLWGGRPLDLQKAVDEYRFNKVDSLVEMSDLFSMERVMAYFIQFLIIQKWVEIDRVRGSMDKHMQELGI